MQYNLDLEKVDMYFYEMKIKGLTDQTWKNKISSLKKSEDWVEWLSMRAAWDKYKVYKTTTQPL